MNLHEPVRALRAWSWHLDLKTGRLPAKAAMIDGSRVTLPRFMRDVTSLLLEMCESEVITEAIAPQASLMLPTIIELTHYLEEGALAKCAPHLTWAAKLLHLLNLCKKEGATLDDPRIRLEDHDFLNTDPARGMFFRLWEHGQVAPLIKKADVDACLRDGPPESRAWGRGRIIRRFLDRITDVNWDFVELRRRDDRWAPHLKINMHRLDSLNRARFGPMIKRAGNLGQLERLLERLEEEPARQEDPMDNIVPHLAALPAPGQGSGRKRGQS
jgi:hypothetical protein